MGSPDCRTENRALLALSKALADSPGTILQTLADMILDVTQSDSWRQSAEKGWKTILRAGHRRHVEAGRRAAAAVSTSRTPVIARTAPSGPCRSSEGGGVTAPGPRERPISSGPSDESSAPLP